VFNVVHEVRVDCIEANHSTVNTMRSLTLGALFLVVVSAHAAPFYVGDVQRIAGTWKLVSIVHEDASTGEKVASPGENAKGYQIATPEGWWMTLITNEPHRAATGGDVGAAAAAPVIAFAGMYRLEKGKVVIKVEAGRVPGVAGTNLVSPYHFDANRLRMEFPQYLFTTAGGRSARTIVTWERQD
jgi:hypothetical protein